jgi:hypothetical protein
LGLDWERTGTPARGDDAVASLANGARGLRLSSMRPRRLLSVLLLAPFFALGGVWCSGPCCPSRADGTPASAIAAPSCCEESSPGCAPTLVRGETAKLAVVPAPPAAPTSASLVSLAAPSPLALAAPAAASGLGLASPAPPRPQLRI